LPSPLVAYRRKPYSKNQFHPEAYERIFERFRNPIIAEVFPPIALLTQVPSAAIYRWQKEFRLYLDWRRNRHQALLNRRIFTKSNQQEIA
jgi:hypothetical protein